MKGLNMLRGLTVFVVIVAISAPTNAQNRRKLDENTLPVPPGSVNNCGSCSSCTNACNQLPPPPPPSPKKHTSKHCPPLPPPPPPSSLIYIPGPPGNLYPVQRYFSGTGRSFAVGLPLWIGIGLLGQLALW
ncbi:unnamed protein product [Ilex paraguariensis]|uniref:Uncharacterized protein n=1 Tax=Ilex paraguariensis TaxID=185542 RepID=A0ABC8SK42_9AQUA